jgi:hypothetical protein
MYATEMGSVAVIYMPSSIKMYSAIQKLTGEIHRHKNTGSMDIA